MHRTSFYESIDFLVDNKYQLSHCQCGYRRHAVRHFSGQAVTSMIVTLFKALKMQKQLQCIIAESLPNMMRLKKFEAFDSNFEDKVLPKWQSSDYVLDQLLFLRVIY